MSSEEHTYDDFRSAMSSLAPPSSVEPSPVELHTLHPNEVSLPIAPDMNAPTESPQRLFAEAEHMDTNADAKMGYTQGPTKINFPSPPLLAVAPESPPAVLQERLDTESPFMHQSPPMQVSPTNNFESPRDFSEDSPPKEISTTEAVTPELPHEASTEVNETPDNTPQELPQELPQEAFTEASEEAEYGTLEQSAKAPADDVLNVILGPLVKDMDTHAFTSLYDKLSENGHRQVYEVRNEYPQHQKAVILGRERDIIEADFAAFDEASKTTLAVWSAKRYPLSAHVMLGGLTLSLMAQGLTWNLHANIFTGLLKITVWSFLAFVFLIEAVAAKGRLHLQELKNRRRQVEIELFETELSK